MMSLSKISPLYAEEEKAVQDSINTYIDQNKSLVFNAGAGAGKTYALTESLKHIIRYYADKLVYHNQKIMCITYTNVATNEIKERLGNSDLVKVSTIHERLWALIKEYKKELVKLHVKKIQSELFTLRFDLEGNNSEKVEKQYKYYRELTMEERGNFKEITFKIKKAFYKFYDKPAKEFKSAIADQMGNYDRLLSNVSNFKKIVSTIYRIDNYEYCLKQIESDIPRYNEVRYEDKYNADILHRMIISHDTLIEYSLRMVEEYTLLRRVILDRYPYILIDEYQDTNKSVVKFMKYVEDYAKNIKRKIFIGYFGDAAQNIYEDGVGGDLCKIHPGLIVVNKQFNRRSHSQIINVINKIRDDEIQQKSIFEDNIGGSVKFFTGSDENKNQFINKYKKQWDITTDNKLHCLVLMNKFVAEFNGFPDIYNGFSETAYYKKNYDSIKNELLNNDISKLGNVPNLFYRILQFINNLANPKTPLSNIIDKKIYLNKMTFVDLKALISILKNLTGISLGSYVENMFNVYSDSNSSYYKRVIRKLMNFERCSHQYFMNYLLDELFLNLGSEKVNDFKQKLRDLFDESYFVPPKKEKIKDVKQAFEDLLGNNFFTYTDTEEINELKALLYKFIEEQKKTDLDVNEKNILKDKMNSLFDAEPFSDSEEDEVDSAKVKINELLNISLKQWMLWYDFINDEHKSDVVYHTYHGTKGAEYNNIIIIMENDFGRRNKNKFSSFFMHRQSGSAPFDEEDLLKFNNTKNLLYVSCSRAIKNLRILYLDDISEFKKGIESIFGIIYPYKTEL
ncbi:MAG: ATP-dependent helicase [Spirochaetes bacterium]|nr:ATP-dependent helicase [Spirochaetota bacterium]